MVLFVNACARKCSRTANIANELLKNINGQTVERVNLYDITLPTLDEELINKRTQCMCDNKNSEILKLAKQFASANTVIIAAPFWDLSFPAVLKRYLELVSVCGITFAYTEKGTPVGLCKAQNLYYITTSGGPIVNDEYGYGYIKALTGGMFGIKNHCIIKAENLDIVGNNADAILKNAKQQISKIKI